MFQKEKMLCLGLQAVPADTSRCSRRKRKRLSDVMLSLHYRGAFSSTSSCACTKGGRSLGLRALPGGRKEILCDFTLFLQEGRKFFVTSSCSRTKDTYSLRLQAVPARQRREFFETSRCSRTKEGNSLLLQRILARQG